MLHRPAEKKWAYKQPPEPFPLCPSKGCFLGPSGSGKSTTLISMLAEQHLGREQARAIHGTITSGISHYNRVRDTGLQIGGAAWRIAHALNHP